ncbi:MAG TPA: PASTA domain-containing protein [Myxococcales bacterium]|nr:PASTA domain-containing protein [Myxococcales bacterium]
MTRRQPSRSNKKVKTRQENTAIDLEELQLRRMGLMAGTLGLCMLSIVGTCVYLQGCEGAAFKSEAERNYQRKMRLDTQRGDIMDRNREVLATSVEVDTIYANPSEVDEPVEVAAELAAALDLDAEMVLRSLTSGGQFRYIKRQVTADESAKVMALKLPGIRTLREAKRFYPKKEMAGQLLGVVGFDSRGREGIEATFDESLRGGQLEARYHRNAYQRYAMLEGLPPIESEAGHSLQLTIDEKIQAVMERELERVALSSLAISAMGVVMDVQTGEVLALAHYPRFNPNRYRSEIAQDNSAMKAGKRVVHRYRNRVIADQFEPGSTMKMFTLAAGLEEGLVGLDDIIDTENGRYRVGRKTIHDAHRYKKLSVEEIIKYSSNIGCIKIAQMLGRERLHGYLREFGFGSRTRVGVVGDASGTLHPPKNWAEITLANVAFGQGVAVTALQLLSAASAIGNGGLLMRPRILKAERDSQGRILREWKPEIVRRVVSVTTAQQVLKALTRVVEHDGTGSKAWLYDYDVAGKTGTAQKPDNIAGGYAEDRWIATFMGLVPSKRPRIAMLVVVDEPQGLHYGGAVAAPVFQKVASWTLQYLGVAPTYGKRERLRRKKRQLRKRKRSNPPREAEGAFYDYPAGRMPGVNPMEPLSIEVPDFSGLSIRDAAELAQQHNLILDISGRGRAAGQAVPSGTPLDPWSRITVYFRELSRDGDQASEELEVGP